MYVELQAWLKNLCKYKGENTVAASLRAESHNIPYEQLNI